jgi:hypothetical protein
MRRKCGALLDEIHKIRREIYEETKDMSSEDLSEYYRKNIEGIAKEYDFLILESPDHKGMFQFSKSKFGFKLP